MKICFSTARVGKNNAASVYWSQPLLNYVELIP